MAGVLVALGAMPVARRPRRSSHPGSAEVAGKSYPYRRRRDADRQGQSTIVTLAERGGVFSLACPHQNTAIRWYEEGAPVQSPAHSRFEVDGIYLKDSGRATRNMDRFAVRKDWNNVVVNLDKLYQEDEDEAAWKAAFVALTE